MKKPDVQYRAATAARLLIALCSVGVHCCSRGYCVGSLKLHHITLERGFVVREFSKSRIRAVINAMSAWTHRRRGHDEGCLTFGVSISTVRALVCQLSNTDISMFLLELYREVCGQHDVAAMSCNQKITHLTHEIEGAITTDDTLYNFSELNTEVWPKIALFKT